MVNHIPQWDALRIRTPIPREFPGYQFVPFETGDLLYVLGNNGTVFYCIDPEAGEVISEGQPLFPTSNGNFDSTDAVILPSFCPTDGTITIGKTNTLNPTSWSAGLASRHGDTSILFPTGSGGGFNDTSSGPGEYCAFGGLLASKNDTRLSAISTGAFSCEADRAGNWYSYTTTLTSPPKPAVTRSTPNGATTKWTVAPASMPGYSARTGKDKQIVVGTPEFSGGSWFQSVFVGNATGWLSKHDCRTGTQTAGGQTLTTNGWPYNLQPSQLNATFDGLVVLNVSKIEKLSLSDLSLIWRHDPTALGLSPASIGRVCVNCCGDVFYLTTTIDASGAIRLRKLNGADGSVAWDKPFWLPIINSPMVSSCGRIGGFEFASEPWVRAGRPAIDFG